MSMLSRTVIGFGLAVGLAASGCSAAGGDATVSAKVELVNHVTQAYSSSNAAQISMISGTYGDSCRDHGGGASWSVGANDNTDIGSATLLEVVKNDAACQLTLTAVVIDGTTFAGTPSLTLAADYATTASGFAVAGRPAAFFANANIDTSTFAADFTIRLVVSDPPRDSYRGAGATYKTQTATVVASAVAAPNYFLSMGYVTYQADVNDVVASVGGYSRLWQGGGVAQSYAVVPTFVDSENTLEEIATIWAAATVTGQMADLEGDNFPTSNFLAVGDQLTAHRTLMLRNTEDGVSSYQLIKIWFYGADY